MKKPIPFLFMVILTFALSACCTIKETSCGLAKDIAIVDDGKTQAACDKMVTADQWLQEHAW